jgi:Ca2+-binding RTX toxin-like protein
LQGGIGNDTLRAGEGDDLLNGGGGDDVIYAGYGNDTMTGGFGRDTLRFDLITDPNGVVANLTTQTFSYADIGTLSVSGFENLYGTAQNDQLTGDGLANLLTGAAGADLLNGAGGNDTLVGGAKSDTMDGGAGADMFLFNALTDSNATYGIDRINNFATEDIISLRAIDPVAGGADDAFVWRGTAAFTGAVAEVRYYQDAGTTVIEVRRAGMVSDDMQIVLGSLITLTAANFQL